MRLLTSLACLLLSVFVLAACGNDDEKEKTDTKTDVEVTDTTKPDTTTIRRPIPPHRLQSPSTFPPSSLSWHSS